MSKQGQVDRRYFLGVSAGGVLTASLLTPAGEAEDKPPKARKAQGTRTVHIIGPPAWHKKIVMDSEKAREPIFFTVYGFVTDENGDLVEKPHLSGSFDWKDGKDPITGEQKLVDLPVYHWQMHFEQKPQGGQKSKLGDGTITVWETKQGKPTGATKDVTIVRKTIGGGIFQQGPPAITSPLGGSTVSLPFSCYGVDGVLLLASGCWVGSSGNTGTIVSDIRPNWQVNFSSGSSGNNQTLTITDQGTSQNTTTEKINIQ